MGFRQERSKPAEGTDLHVEMRVYERGSGETLACGSGALAVGASALRDAGLTTGVVAVDLPGGRLQVIRERLRPVLQRGRSLPFGLAGWQQRRHQPPCGERHQARREGVAPSLTPDRRRRVAGRPGHRLARVVGGTHDAVLDAVLDGGDAVADLVDLSPGYRAGPHAVGERVDVSAQLCAG